MRGLAFRGTATYKALPQPRPRARPRLCVRLVEGMDSYTTLPWANVCAEVAKLRVQIVERRGVALPRLVAVGGDPDVSTRA